VLVAVAIFALAAALAYGGLDAVVRARAQLDAENDRLGQVQFAFGLIERDVRGVVARGVRDGYGAPLPPLFGTRDRIELTRQQGASMLPLPRAQLERVSYRVQDHALQRLRYRVLDRTPASTPREDALLDRVESLQIAYLTRDGRELAQWPAPRASDDAPPRAVTITLRLADYGELRRVLELPDEAAP
jgi:general secretion pathway protein J